MNLLRLIFCIDEHFPGKSSCTIYQVKYLKFNKNNFFVYVKIKLYFLSPENVYTSIVRDMKMFALYKNWR